MSKESIEKLKKLIRDNKAFNKEYKKEIKELESKTVLEVGKWYKTKGSKHLMFLSELIGNEGIGYGFDTIGAWFGITRDISMDSVKPATDKEVETALIAEAKKRGFKEGVTVKCIHDNTIESIKGTFFNNKESFNLYAHIERCDYIGQYVFKDGKWAEIINTVHIKDGDYTEAQIKDVLLTFGHS